MTTAHSEEPTPDARELARATSALDSVVHHPVRLGILTVTAAVERCPFAYLKQTLEVTDGNLSRNISVLEEHGLVVVDKGYEGRRPRTWVTATEKGRRALSDHLHALQALSAWRPAPPPS